MYVKTDLAYNQRIDLAHDSLEAVWRNILLPKSKLIVVGCCYRPPKQYNFLEQFEECVAKIDPEMEVLILGDMNICVLKKSGWMYNNYKRIQDMYGMSQLVSQVTRETPTSATILDHIICSRKDRISQNGV